MSGGLALVGAAALAKVFKEAIEAAGGPQEYWVGSAVPYGPFHEFGTGRLPARPHWSVAVGVISERYRLADGNKAINEMLAAPRGLVQLIAFDFEREVKILITILQILDTGNYRGSIATGPTEATAVSASAAKSKT